ncbi:MAG: RNA polymerase sigma factor [Lachnospiraceae bacterium]|nr:RNA polymerase sigma factor [Lachnospiraceae bacterium]
MRNPETDEVSYRRFLDGEEQGLALLMERYGDRLMRYLYGYIHDFHDAEDLMIEAFAYLAVKKPDIRDGGLKAYLFKTGRHLAFRFGMKMWRHRSFSLEAFELEPESGSAGLPEELLLAQERNQTMHDCMMQLCENYREALFLVYFEGLSYREAAQIMGRNEKQIDNYVTRGRQALRKCLEKEGITHA